MLFDHKVKSILYLFIVLAMNSRVVAQYTNADLDSIIRQYSFIDTTANYIQNDTSLNRFYAKALSCQTKQIGVIKIIHIGDSHIQAGSLTKPIQLGLQKQLGYGGRGLVFPYQIARTNGPSDIVSSSNVKWMSRRNSVRNSSLPTGLSGHVIYSTDSNAIIKIKIKEPDTGYIPITRIQLMHGSITDSNYAYQLMDSNGAILATPSAFVEQSDTVTTFILPGKHSSFTIGQVKNAPNQISSTFFGCLVDNGVPGLIYHTIGVNGAEYKSYLEADKFLAQLAWLSPDLIILSMGTNEAFNTKNFSEDGFSKYVFSLIDTIKQLNPQSAILITTLPESLKPYRVKKRTYYRSNPNVATIHKLLISAALLKGVAFWDLYTIMGGLNSMTKWHAAGMTDSKRVHFSHKGYQIQGQLLYNALWNSLLKYKQEIN
jgi:lysophospholipase L1-like esterase